MSSNEDLNMVDRAHGSINYTRVDISKLVVP